MKYLKFVYTFVHIYIRCIFICIMNHFMYLCNIEHEVKDCHMCRIVFILQFVVNQTL